MWIGYRRILSAAILRGSLALAAIGTGLHIGASVAVASCVVACSTASLCVAGDDPCSISGSHEIGDGCLLDFGARTVIVRGTLKSTLSGGHFCVRAGNLTLEGGALKAVGTAGSNGGSIEIGVAGAFVMNATGPKINVAGPGGGGSVALAAGSIDILAGAPAVNADGTTIGGDGGGVIITAAGRVRIGATISANGGSDAAGGGITIVGQDIEIQKKLSVSGGSFDAGSVDLRSTGGDIVLTSGAAVVGNGGSYDGFAGDGGEITVIAAGNVDIMGLVEASGVADSAGGSVDVIAAGDITVSGPVRANGGGGGGDGGTVDIDAGTAILAQATIRADGNGAGASGGWVLLVAAGAVVLEDTVSAEGGGSGGDGETIEISSGADVTIRGVVRVSGHGSGGAGGTVTVDAEGALLVEGSTRAMGGGDGLGGNIDIDVRGDIVIAPGGSLAVNGGRVGGAILSVGSPGALIVDGVLEARGTGGGGGGTIDLGPHCTAALDGSIDATGSLGGADGTIVVRAGAIDSGASVVMAPAATLVIVDASLLPCCGNGAPNGPEECDDGNSLRCDGCTPLCTLEPSPLCADDGDPCTSVSCVPAVGCVTEPLSNVACPDDGAQCTDDICKTGICTHSPRVCDDGIACTQDGCDPGSGCFSVASDLSCDDGNPCTDDSCDGVLGCVSTERPDGSTCTDFDVCTTGDQCAAGLCVSTGVPINCDDGNPCTVDACNAGVGCSNREDATACRCTIGPIPVAAGTPCADGDSCTIGDLCDGNGGCIAGPPRDCDDSDVCTADQCIDGVCLHADDRCPESCVGVPDGALCSDGLACTVGRCIAEICTASARPCADGDPCTGEEICVDAFGIGCRNGFPPQGIACDDGNPCTTGDTCGNGACQPGLSVVCADDGNPCTEDTCNPATGACGTPNDAPCDDGDPCTVNDVCAAGACQPGVLMVCADDGNPCTDAACDPSTGGCGIPNTNPCDDGNECSVNDSCRGGVCTGDSLVCGFCEACDPSVGCVNAPRQGCRRSTVPRKASILLRRSDAGDRSGLLWKWTKGEATDRFALGDPATTDDYRLCVFENTGATAHLLLGPAAPAGGKCAGRDCWNAKGKPPGARGYKYKDAELTPDGLRTLQLKPGEKGRAKIVVKGRGVNLGMPPLDDLALPLTVQLQAENGSCWEASYFPAGVIKGRADMFKAKGGSACAAFIEPGVDILGW